MLLEVGATRCCHICQTSKTSGLADYESDGHFCTEIRILEGMSTVPLFSHHNMIYKTFENVLILLLYCLLPHIKKYTKNVFKYFRNSLSSPVLKFTEIKYYKYLVYSTKVFNRTILFN